jgi:hypothetical protein
MGQRALLLALAGVVLGSMHPPPAAADKAPRTIRGEYARLVAEGCDPVKFGIATAIEARVLRNVPYAVAGQRFDSEELRAIYAADGAWYQPKARRVGIGKQDASCVARLGRHEALVRKQLPIDKAVEAVLTRDPKVFWGLRDDASYPNRYRKASSRKSAHEWSWGFEDGGACGGDGSPESADDCSGLTVMCSLPEEGARDWAALQCDLLWAG